jgi:hypothetical protein
LLQRRAVLAFIVVLCTLPSWSQTPADEFVIIALPDTQHYSEKYPWIFNAQAKWIADNQDDLNIKFVVGLGDIVQGGAEIYQWQRADYAVNLFDYKIPYILPLGNHDYDKNNPSGRTPYTKNFNAYFGPARYSGKTWYKGHWPSGSNENLYATFEASGRRYLVIGLEFHPRTEALEWAGKVIAANPGREVIIATHSYMLPDNFRGDRCDHHIAAHGNNVGEEMWQKLVSKYANIRMVLSGHVGNSGGAGRRTDVGLNGNLVNQMLSDYQSYANGGQGYLRIIRVQPSLNKLVVSTYSPYLKQYLSGSAHNFTMPYLNNGQFNGSPGAIDGKVRKYDCTILSGATVSVNGVSATTNYKGVYKVSNLPAEKTHNSTAYYGSYASITKPAYVRSGFATTRQFYLAPGGRVEGKVVNSYNKGLSGAKIRFKGGVVAIDKSVTADDYGQYKSGLIPMGKYTVTADASGYASKQTTVDLSSGEFIPLGFTMGTTGSYTVQGKITSAVDGRPLADALVTLGSRSDSTDYVGNYYFSSVGSGTYTLKADAAGFLPRSTSLSVGTSSVSHSMKLSTAGKLTGKVRASSGLGISGATVKLSGGVIGSSFTLTTGNDGSFATAWIPVGTYSVTVSKSGYSTRSGSAAVQTGDTTSYSTTLSQ